MPSITENKCPLCGGVLAFDPVSGKVVCQYCDSIFEPGAVGLDARGEPADVAEPAFPGEAEEGPEFREEAPVFDWGNYKENAAKLRLDGTAVYHCRSCGAVIETDATTAATRCPYCGNEVVIDERVSGGLRPNGIIPFKYTKQDLPALMKRYWRRRPLLPRSFITACRTEQVQGCYVPFWLFDCGVEGSVVLDGTKVRTWHDSQYDYTETSHYDLYRAGGMQFEGIPVDGSAKMPNDLMDSLEPYDRSEIKPFDGSYLAGFLADRFDEDPDESLPRASERLMKSAVNTFTGTGGGYASVKVKENNLNLFSAAVNYVLLPVYLVHCTYRKKPYTYAINGQTGKVAGQLPISRGRGWAFFLGVTAVVSAVAGWLLSRG